MKGCTNTVVTNILRSARGTRLTSSSTLCLLSFLVVALLGSSSGLYARPRSFAIGTFDGQGKLHNRTEDKFKLSLSSFVVYFLDEKDLNLGFSIGPKVNRSYALTLDVAPHHAGLGATWFLSAKSRYLWIRALAGFGAGAGFNYTYNTITDKFELGIKGTLIRW